MAADPDASSHLGALEGEAQKIGAVRVIVAPQNKLFWEFGMPASRPFLCNASLLLLHNLTTSLHFSFHHVQGSCFALFIKRANKP